MVEYTPEEAEMRMKELAGLLACSRGDYYREILREYMLLKLARENPLRICKGCAAKFNPAVLHKSQGSCPACGMKQ